jgi:putative phosphoesterase
MKIGILSDTHNNAANTRDALAIFQAEGISRLVHCGDMTTGQIVMLFAGWDVTFVLGNGDLFVQELNTAAGLIGVQPPRPVASLTLDGLPVAVVHGHHDLERLIRQQDHRYVLHGHTHRRRDERIGSTRVINPGALGGRRIEPRSVAVLDLATDTLRFIELPEQD